ncbi:MAG TPA: LytTR family transcriptional regulator DNA-binding domain-containing protein [Bacteroidales bacterium]|nr:LytTR family transcriptional regulator DNA-binding domain-containing protein [Bacteroidales bacterium]HPO65108.1 LytTR family transcriptional regulator DNA-binding domain-containing protein [Bacteroidales bacterium]
MENIRAIIIEDEEPARMVLREYIKKFPHISIIAEIIDGFNAVKTINEQKPDLIFLDIQLPKLTGFEVLELIEHTPIIIFTTAYDQYAIQAFEKNAVDYLLKPFSEERFNTAIQKAIEKLAVRQNDSTTVKKVVDYISSNPPHLDRIVVKTNSAIKVIPLEQVIYLEAQDDYVMIYTTGGKHLKEKTMKYFETHLPDRQFVRIHRSYIVNIDFIAQIEHFSKETYLAILKNGTKLKISESGYKLLRERLNF